MPAWLLLAWWLLLLLLLVRCLWPRASWVVVVWACIVVLTIVAVLMLVLMLLLLLSRLDPNALGISAPLVGALFLCSDVLLVAAAGRVEFCGGLGVLLRFVLLDLALSSPWNHPSQIVFWLTDEVCHFSFCSGLVSFFPCGKTLEASSFAFLEIR